jgi:flagellar protein FlaG
MNIEATGSVAPSLPNRADPVRAASIPEAKRVQVARDASPDVSFDPEELKINLRQAVEMLNQQLQEKGRDLSFKMDDTLNRPVITVISATSGEVVRQIPTEVVVRVAHNIELVKGMLIDEIG